MRKLIHFFLLTIYTHYGALTLKVDLYENAEFKDLSQTIDLDDADDCVTLSYGRKVVSSVNSHGGCINLFSEPECSGEKLKIAPGIHSHNNLAVWKFSDKTVSIGSCNAAEQKKKLKPKQFGLYSGKWQNDLLFESVEKPCSCVTLPPSVKRRTMSVNTHGNCLKLYNEDNCGGNSITLDVGSDHHGNLDNLNFGNKAVSLSGCTNVKSCIKLKATIYKLDFGNDVEARIAAAAKGKVQMQATVYIRNNGTATITKEVAATKTITDRFEFEKLSSVAHMHHVGVESSLEVCGGFPGFASLNVGVRMAYNREGTWTSQTRTLNATERAKSFVVKASIAVPPCTIYTVKTFVDVLDNFPMEYDIYMKIQGEESGRVLGAEELKRRLKAGVLYVRVLNSNTIIAKTVGRMTAHVGINSRTDGSGKKIEGCNPNGRR